MSDVRAAVAATARMLAAAGLVEAFGHVSARTPEGVAITSVRPLGTARAGDVAVLDPDGAVVAGPAGELPLERALHLAVYARRPDVGAICRGHPASAVAWGVAEAELPLRHGLGLLAGRHVGVHGAGDLITTEAEAQAAAAALGGDRCLLLRANGALAVGADLAEAATRLWFLDQRARVALAPAPGSPPGEALWDLRERHTPAELRRAARWFTATYGDRNP